MNSIRGLIGPEQLELFALELGKIATFDFVYSLASTNINQSAPNLVTMNMSISFKHLYFTSIEKQVLATYTNLSRFCFLGTTPVIAPNAWANEKSHS